MRLRTGRLHGISFAVEGFESLISGELRHGRLLHFRDKVHRQRRDHNHAARQAARRQGTPLAAKGGA